MFMLLFTVGGRFGLGWLASGPTLEPNCGSSCYASSPVALALLTSVHTAAQSQHHKHQQPLLASYARPPSFNNTTTLSPIWTRLSFSSLHILSLHSSCISFTSLPLPLVSHAVNGPAATPSAIAAPSRDRPIHIATITRPLRPIQQHPRTPPSQLRQMF